jgi:Dolichyl-phosphate-mannose-protein mannosyltransferase
LPPTPITLARAALLVPALAVFLLPGWILGRVLRTPFAAVTAFLGSAALAFNLILLLDALRVPLEASLVAGTFLVVTLALALWAKRRAVPLSPGWQVPALPVGGEWLWVIPPALALVSIAARGLVEPLAGYDNSFRWDYLARLMVTHHSLASYPPMRMEDFDLYPWCDGIPPLVPFLNFLTYSAAGSLAPGLITLRPVCEFLLLAALAFRFACDLWGRGAGLAAVAVLGSCTLLIWGLAIEQETGLTAIGLLAMVYFLRRPKAGEGEESSVAWAGVAAGIGAISREYGLYFVILGGLVLGLGGRARSLPRFLIAAAAVAAPWYVRNWVKTGNPVYPAMGAVFPTNALHVELMGNIASFMGYGSSPVPLGVVLGIVLATSGAAWVLGLAGLVRLRFRAPAIASAVVLVTVLWLWSMPQTAAGWPYSTRVLLPALALGSVLSGWVGTLGVRSRFAAAILIALLSVDSARRAWLLPDFPFTTPWSLSFDEWRMARAQDDLLRRRNIWPVLTHVAGDRFMVVDDPQPFVAAIAAGGHPTPLMSPRAAALFDPSLTLPEAVRRLRSLGVRFVTISNGNPVINKLIRRHATLSQLADDYAPVMEFRGLLIFDLEYLAPKPVAAGLGP